MTNTKSSRQCSLLHPEPAATAWRCSECARSLTGLPVKLRRRGLCASLGEMSRTVECDSCNGRVALKVYACPIMGEATLSQKLGEVAAICDKCSRWSPASADEHKVAIDAGVEIKRDTFSLISPMGTGKVIEGIAAKKPWHYTSTAIIPHLNTLESLAVVIDLLRLQTQPPYIVIVDTGSPFGVCDELESMRSDDVEIHFLRANGWTHTSEPVTCALDVGFARASTPLIFLTHTDCFPTKRNSLQWLGDQCSLDCPVVGWEMSERSWLTDQWKGVVSHTFTMLHARTMRDIGATWHMARARDSLGLNSTYQSNGWPDTETGFDLVLKAAGIRPKLLGSEINFERQVTDWWDHARSFTGTRLYVPGSSQGAKTEAYTADALEDARERIEAWKGGGSMYR